MFEQSREDRGTAPALVVAVMLAIIASALIVLLYERAGQYPPAGRESLNLSFSSGELERLEQKRLVPDRLAALLRPSLPNR